MADRNERQPVRNVLDLNLQALLRKIRSSSLFKKGLTKSRSIPNGRGRPKVHEGTADGNESMRKNYMTLATPRVTKGPI
ncbi:mutant gag-pol polyprotein [Gossypium australe]|uniref:Mutant gag-pol polyprotein n=1 Tax=Gossypium australe TaxID=47621 RepID=A0A5B6WN83_9ROSI|nr:mutant gag-pol polyprotein [Gossypium australe]